MTMTSIILIALCSVIAAGIGVFMGRKSLQGAITDKQQEAEAKAADILKTAELQAETLKKDRMLETKEKYLRLKTEFEEQTNEKRGLLQQNEAKLKQREQQLTQQADQQRTREGELNQLKNEINQVKNEIGQQKNAIAQQTESLARHREEVDKQQAEAEKMLAEQVSQLEKIAGLSAAEALERMVETLKAEADTRASAYVKNMLEEAKLTATKEAKKVVIDTIQRTATEHAIENCVSIFNIESDDIKGKIIGREGRNIRALEAATGVEIIVDDTPEAIIISGFDPVRREVARLSLHRLVQDGRIHPARIEEIVAKTRKNIDDEIIEIGERTVIDLGIHGLHPELIKMVGRMRFRSSYGQNLLQHSREVAKLCATMAAELGLNAKLAKRAGLLHDIGKVWPEEAELPHALLGMELAKKYKENPEVINAIGAHHDEIEMTTMISPIVQVCDAVSGSRPGARREMMESYIKRLKELEELATNFQGVVKCYAIQAGRELRVMVDADHVSDERASTLSFEISQKIEKEMQYPGQIKVTVIREMRSVAYAK